MSCHTERSEMANNPRVRTVPQGSDSRAHGANITTVSKGNDCHSAPIDLLVPMTGYGIDSDQRGMQAR